VNVPPKYEWIVASIGKRRPTEAGQARLIIVWLVAFLIRFGLVLEEADKTALNEFCRVASIRRTDVSMNRLVYTIRNIYSQLHSRNWISMDPANDLGWSFKRQRRYTLDIDLVAVEELLEHIDRRRTAATEEEVRNRLCVQLAVDTGASCSELSDLNVAHVGRNNAIRVASGRPRERIARLSPDAGADLSSLEHRRDLFGLGSDALFASSRGSRERLPLRSIAQVIQMQIEDAGLTDRICPADLARYPVAKLISEGAGAQDAIIMVGYKRVPGVSGETAPSGSGALKAFHPLHS
jgi:site-specific recombinase XerD